MLSKNERKIFKLAKNQKKINWIIPLRKNLSE